MELAALMAAGLIALLVGRATYRLLKPKRPAEYLPPLLVSLDFEPAAKEAASIAERLRVLPGRGDRFAARSAVVGAFKCSEGDRAIYCYEIHRPARPSERVPGRRARTVRTTEFLVPLARRLDSPVAILVASPAVKRALGRVEGAASAMLREAVDPEGRQQSLIIPDGLSQRGILAALASSLAPLRSLFTRAELQAIQRAGANGVVVVRAAQDLCAVELNQVEEWNEARRWVPEAWPHIRALAGFTPAPD